MRFKPGVSADDHTMATLKRVLESAKQLRHGSKLGFTHEYGLWAIGAQHELSGLFRSQDVVDFVITPRFLAAGAVNPPAAAEAIIYGELDRFIADLSDVIAALANDRARWHLESWIVVPDTNVLLHHPEPFWEINWHELLNRKPRDRREALFNDLTPINVVLPIIVVDELDSQKRKGQGPVKARARQTLQRVDQLLEDVETDRQAVIPRGDDSSGVVTLEVVIDPLSHVRLPDPDSEIADRVLSIRQLANRRVTLLTYDTGMALRARSVGVDVQHLDPPPS